MSEPSDSSNNPRAAVLQREEYIEQAYLFRGLSGRLASAEPIQELLLHLREEILATTKLPFAIGYLLAELNHVGTMSSAMQKMPHYFAPFQTYLISEAENERGRFDMNLALRILEQEARMRAEQEPCVSMFFFQFEAICRNRLSYDYGLQAMSQDSVYNEDWSAWIMNVQYQIGIVDIADLVYVHSQHYLNKLQANDSVDSQRPQPILFGIKEGRIALANRNKQTLYFFSALQRQLAYPSVPKPVRKDPAEDLLPKLIRNLERFEVRLKLLEDEQRDKGIDLSQFYDQPNDDRPDQL